MHMMTIKDLSSEELDTWRRSRNPTVVLTANGEVHTKEEAQVFVHDPKFIRDCAITRRNACCSIAWKTLRRPRIFLWVGQRSKTHGWPKKGRQFFARRTSSYLSSFQGYLPDLEAIRRQHRHCRICQQFQLKNEVTNSHQETGADHPQKPKNKKKKRDDSRDSDDRLRDLREWLEEFTDNLEDSDSERPTKVASTSRKHSLILTSQRTEIAKSAWEPKWQGLLAEDALAKLNFEQKSLVTW